ncbi:hypothetical protein PYCC9005_000619 [Savitreella phatthalungensis]
MSRGRDDYSRRRSPDSVSGAARITREPPRAPQGKEEPTGADTAAQVAALVQHYKKSGKFDQLRRQILRDWEASSAGQDFHNRLKEQVERQLPLINQASATSAGTSGRGAAATSAAAAAAAASQTDRAKRAAALNAALDNSTIYKDVAKQARLDIFDSPEFRKPIETVLREKSTRENASKPPSTTTLTTA